MHALFLILVTGFLFTYHVAETEKMWCSEYLLSGFSGVPNEAFTASSSYNLEGDFSPDNARLYFERPNIISASGWCSLDRDEQTFIQVQLDTEAVVDSVSIQGRGDVAQWVKTFYILYSPDNVTWTKVMTPDNKPKLFTGNTDSNTVVRRTISPPITAKYFRINARSWQNRPCLRFDLGGCIHQSKSKMFGRFNLASLSSLTTLGKPMSLQPPGRSALHCASVCHRQTDCVSFRYDVMFRTCNGYTLIRKTSYSNQEISYYYNTGAVLHRGYKHSESGNFSYKVIELRRNQVNASESCVSQGSFLMKVGTLDRLSLLQSEIQQNNVLKQDFRFYVSGQYTTRWQYRDGDVIDSTLWSPSNSDPAQGHCVMLTQNGLSSVNCNLLLFFIYISTMCSL